jgi:hypothetical protein
MSTAATAAAAVGVDALAQQDEHVQQELAELILQVQSKNHSLFTETLHRYNACIQLPRRVDLSLVFQI